MTTATPSSMPTKKPTTTPPPDDLRARVDAAVAKFSELGSIMSSVQDLVNLIAELRARNDELEAKFALMHEALFA